MEALATLETDLRTLRLLRLEIRLLEELLRDHLADLGHLE